MNNYKYVQNKYTSFIEIEPTQHQAYIPLTPQFKTLDNRKPKVSVKMTIGKNFSIKSNSQ